MRPRKLIAAAAALGLGLGVALVGAIPAAAEPIIGYTDPGYLTTDTVLDFTGITETEIASLTITLPSGESDECEFTQPDASSWSCGYTPMTTLTAGEGNLHFEFFDPYAVPEDETFTVSAPENAEAYLGELPLIYETTTTLSLSGTTNYPLSGITLTLSNGVPHGCEIVDPGPDYWSCTYEDPTGLPFGTTYVTFDFDDAYTDQTFASDSFEVLRAATLDSETSLSSTATVNLSGTTATPISAATITFADDITQDCALGEHLDNEWNCSYDPGDDPVPAGPAVLRLTFTESDAVDPFDLNVNAYDATPEIAFDGFTPGAIGVTATLTGNADTTYSTIVLYGWDGEGDDNTGTGCPWEVSPQTCTISADPGTWEIRAVQNWTVDDNPSTPTATSLFFRVPEAPHANAHPQADGSVAFQGTAGQVGDHITVTDATNPDPETNVLCEADATYNYDDEVPSAVWSCTSETSDVFISGHYSVTATDTCAGDDEDGPCSDALSDFPEGYGQSYYRGGVSAVRDIQISIPQTSYSFRPAGVTVSATPTAPGTKVAVQFYNWNTETDSRGCPDLTGDEEGEDDFPGIQPGTLTCSLDDLEPGEWDVAAYQDNGDALTETGPGVFGYFYVPNAPTLADRASGTATNAVTFSGDAGPVPGEGDDDFRAYPGDLIHVVSGGAGLCDAVIDDDFSWRCTTGSLPGATYSVRSYAEDRTYGVNDCDCDPSGYLPGGRSRLSDRTLVITLPALPTGGTGTTPNTGTTPTAPLAPSWSFDLKGLDLNHVHPGQKFTITGGGLPAGSVITIELHSTPVTLGTVTVGPDGKFSLSGTIPSSVEPGEHHIVATLTGPGIAPSTVDKAITIEDATSDASTSTTSGTTAEGDASTGTHEGGVVGDPHETGALAPNVLTNGLNSIADVFAHPEKVPSALAVGLVLLIFAILPAHLLNATISEQYDHLVRRVPRLQRTPRWLAALRAWVDRAPFLGGLAITTATALLFGFVDPKFGFNLLSLRLFLAVAIALFVTVYLANAIAGRIVQKRWAVDVKLSIRPLGLILTIIGVMISRALDFSPGFLIGLVLGLSIAGKSAASHAWKAVLIRSGIVIGVALVAWLGYSAFPAGEHEGSTFLSELALETLVAITTEGVVALLVELLPIRLLEGERLYKHSRVLWATVYLALLVIFIVAVVPWEGNWAELGSSLWSWLTLVILFGVICVAIYVFFRIRSRNEHEDENADEKLVSISDNE